MLRQVDFFIALYMIGGFRYPESGKKCVFVEFQCCRDSCAAPPATAHGRAARTQPLYSGRKSHMGSPWGRVLHICAGPDLVEQGEGVEAAG